MSDGSDTMLEKLNLRADKSSNWSGNDAAQIKSDTLSDFDKTGATQNRLRMTGYVPQETEEDEKWQKFSQELFELINRLRKEPRWVILHLKKVVQRFKGNKLYSHTEQQKNALNKKKKKGDPDVVVTSVDTVEGAAAYNDAIAFLDK